MSDRTTFELVLIEHHGCCVEPGSREVVEAVFQDGRLIDLMSPQILGDDGLQLCERVRHIARVSHGNPRWSCQELPDEVMCWGDQCPTCQGEDDETLRGGLGN